MRGVKSILAEKLMSFDWLWQMWRVNSRTAVWDYNAFVRTYWTNREAIGMGVSVSVMMIIISSFTETLCVVLLHDSIIHTILWPDSRGRFVRSVQCKAVRRPRGLNFNIYLWILWQTGGSYSIVSHFFFFFYKVFREKNSYRPGKNAVRSNFSLFSLADARRLFSPPPLGSASECTMYREERLECGLDRRELHTSTATWLRSAVDIQLSWTKRTKTVTRLFELYWGTEFPPCVLVFFFFI